MLDLSLSFTLNISNTTKKFMKLVDVSNAFAFKEKVLCSWHRTDRFHFTELTQLDTFIVPPFTKEKLIFMKHGYKPWKNYLKSVLVFHLSDFYGPNYSNDTDSQRIMAMFRIEGPGKNSYAVGFPDRDLDKRDYYEILKNPNSSNYYTKGFISSREPGDQYKPGTLIRWPIQKLRGGFEALYSIGNTKRCVGHIIVKKIPETKFNGGQDENKNETISIL